MLNPKQQNEIREHLEKSQNPLFFYDNDADGLCSFLILRRFIGRGKGIAVRSYPELNEGYAKKVLELKADYVFILDKPLISRDFVEEIDKIGIPIVWIDHHDIEKADFSEFSNFYSYNPSKNKGKEKSDEPVTYHIYKMTGRKEDLWLAIIGCISDHYLPDFAEDFAKKYSEYWTNGILGPFDAYYRSEIGRIARAFNFGLKDSTSNIVSMQKFLINAQGPQDVFSELIGNRALREKYKEIKKKYDSLIDRARKNTHGRLIFFEYGGELSVSSEIANELSYNFKEKYIAVAYTKGNLCNVSLRGKNVKKILGKVITKLENASGGGHEDAVGARIKKEDLERFKALLEEEIK